MAIKNDGIEQLPVQTSVITDQLKEKKLDPKTEKRIKKLLGKAKIITQKQAKLLQDIIDQAVREIETIKDVAKLGKYGSINIYQTPEAMPLITQFGENIASMFNKGIQFSNKTPSSVVKSLEESVKQSSVEWIKTMGEDLKQRCGQILAEGIKNETLPEQLSKRLQHELNIDRSHANTIARTETMRAAHAGSYGQALRDGMQFYIIDSRAEACRRCHGTYSNRVYPIDDTTEFPPLHPNCACIPVYYRDSDEAFNDAKSIVAEIKQRREQLTKEGLYLPKDGSGPLGPGAPGYQDPNKKQGQFL